MISYHENISTTINKNIEIKDLIKEITKEEIKLYTENVRLYDKETQKEKYRNAQKNLPLICFSSVFKENTIHSISNIDERTNLACLDYDHLQDTEELFNKLIKIPYIHFIYRSTSGKGLKVVIKINMDEYSSTDINISDEDYNIELNNIYKLYYDYLDEILFDTTNTKADDKARDISRVSYISYDENYYYNKSSKTVDLDIEYIKSFNQKEYTKVEIDATSRFDIDNLIRLTEMHKLDLTDEYNNWIYFANLFIKVYTAEEALKNFHRVSMLSKKYNSKNVTRKFKNILINPNKGETFKETYYKMMSDNNIKITKTKVKLNNDEEIDQLENTPYIKDEVFELLPKILKNMTNNFKNNRERDSFFTAELSAISTLLPNVFGIYWGKEVFPNMYSYIIAPSASGKGCINYCKDTLKETKKLFKEEHLEKIKDFEGKTPPSEKTLYVAGNSSARAMFNQLEVNEGEGCIFETEADTLVTTMKNDWGDFTETIRKGTHNEEINLSRVGESFEIEKCKLSMVLSGTISSALKLVNSENGTLSRMIYYIFKQEYKFANPFLNNINMNDIFRKYGNELKDVFEYYRRDKTEVYCSNEQGEILQQYFNKKQKNLIDNFEGNDINGVITRYGLLSFKIAMILTILYDHEDRNVFTKKSDRIMISNKAFKVSLMLMDTYLKHVELLFENVNDNDKIELKVNTTKEIINFIKNQKKSFKSSDIYQKGKELGICESTIKNKLQSLIKNGTIAKSVDEDGNELKQYYYVTKKVK